MGALEHLAGIVAVHKKQRDDGVVLNMRLADELLVEIERACEPHEVFWMQMADDGESIRRWSRTPFEGARQCRVALSSQAA